MIFLGVHYGHNATVAIVKDGVLIFCQSEERLNRIKNSTGFPVLTLDYIYKNIVRPEDIDRAVLFQKSIQGYLFLKQTGFKSFQYGHYMDPCLIKTGFKQKLLKTNLGWLTQKKRINAIEKDQKMQQEAHRYFSSSLKLPDDKVKYLDHHLAHTFSTIPNTQNEGKVLIFTLDGSGDWKCATVSLYENDAVTVLNENDHQHSLGYYYCATTTWLGMKAGEHEFKVMGLAPYARPNYYGKIVERLSRLLKITEKGEWLSSINPLQIDETLEQIYRYQRFDNVAGAIQELTERLVPEWIHYWIQKTKCHSIAVAGGVFMNVKMCQKLAESPHIRNLFVMPSAADESTAIGAAIWASKTFSPQDITQPIRDLYLGRNYSMEEIEMVFKETRASERYHISVPQKLNYEIAALLAQNEIVARCTGRMEFGARALGNRSILANPSKIENNAIINNAIKNRDFWMPFCPSILAEDIPNYVIGSDRIFAPYMNITFNSTQKGRKDLAATIHPRDFTLRPQCVRKDWNPDYYEIISIFKNLTGVGAILNTSFNLHGEPMVCSPADAIRTMDNSGLKYLVMDKYLLQKKAPESPV